jgi:ribosome biogenesis GTPase
MAVSVSPGDTPPREGIIVEIHGMLVTVLMADGTRLRARPPRDRTTPVIGDRASIITESGEPRVAALAPRERVFMRPNAQGGQLVAAHVDRLVIVTAVEPGPRPGLIDRMWTALGPGIEVVLVLNKCDLPNTPAASHELDDHVAVGALRVLTSTRTGEGMDALSAHLAHGLSLIVGHSGVGKSSLVNALTGATLATGAVNDFTSKGRHTTTVATCHALGPDHLIVDTPGVRAFPLDGMPLQDVAARFPGFSEAAERCHFAHCLHEQEPACAVIASEPPARIARYHALLASLREEAAENRTARYPTKRSEVRKAPPPRRR